MPPAAPAGLELFFQVYIRFFFLLTPFFVTSTFLALTPGMDSPERRRLAARVTMASVALAFGLLFFGNWLFMVMGVTVDAFRVGAGCLLFLSAVDLVRGSAAEAQAHPSFDIAIVPLAVPVTIGPATTGALLIMGADAHAGGALAVSSTALLTAVLTVGIILWMATTLERVLGRKGLAILSKITGLMLSAMSAQMVVTGAAALWKGVVV